jgi:hypothetical protein
VCNTENVCKRVDLPPPPKCDPDKEDCDGGGGGGTGAAKDRIWKQIVNPPRPAE